jgi:3-oxoacyl-[acyl-carrier-protein] synthase II
MSRRVVITGVGLFSPLGNSAEKLWNALAAGESGVRELTSINVESLPTRYGAEARDYTGAIEEFGPLEKTLARTIKKALKVMCREMQMGIAVAQLALTESGIRLDAVDRDRFGVIYGTDHMLTAPQEFTTAIRNCLNERQQFEFRDYADKGLFEVEPLWLLKYLPNLPASHISIFNDLRGPNNSLTMREAAGNLALSEAAMTIARGHADAMLAGATGTWIHPIRTIDKLLAGDIATGSDPARLSRPFDADRTGSVLGEGAACLVVEELATAQARGAKIWGEVIGFASSAVTDARGVGVLKTAFHNVLTGALRSAGIAPDEVGHIHAHGLGTRQCDADEAQAIATVFAGRKAPVPVVAAKSNFGNLGASSGLIELVGSLRAMQECRLFRTLNYETPDPECPVAVVTDEQTPPGDIVLNVSITPQGQASAVVVRRFE